MSTPLNALEFNAQIAALVERYLQLEIAGKTAQNDENAERLCQFVCLDSLESAYLDDDKMRLLAYAVVGAEFQTLIKRGENVSVENQTEKYCRLFDDRCVELDRPELLKRLVQCELYNDPNSPLLRLSRDELQRRFPEIADFFDEYFERRRRAIFSCGVSRFADADADSKTPASVVSTSERYEVDLAPLGDADALGKLGAGGFKDVYAARQTSTNQTVALKILKKSGEEARELFKSEVLLQSKLTHPNVPQIFSFDESGVAPTLVERLIPGKSWGDLFDERSFDDNVATLATVSQIVAYAHERQHIIHADLKPENVMLGESGGRYNEVYLVDWGLARCLDDDGATRRSIGATPYYQPPETFEEVDLELSFATDVFLLGGILFRVLTGDAPYFRSYSAKSAFDAAEDAKKARIPEIPEVNPKTGRVNPPELVEIAKKALRYNPSERYPDAAAFLEALELYRRRASLGERLRAARDSFASLRLKLADAPALTLTQKIASKLTGLSGAVDATRLVETTNEFRLLREEARRSDADDAPSRLFWEAVASERAAYNLFCDAALKSNDLNVARSLLESAQDLEKTVSGLPQPSVPQSLDAQTFASQAVDVAGFNARLNRGFFRNFVQRCAVVGCVFALIAVLGFGYSASKANERAATAQKSEAEANAKAARAGQEKALAQLETAEANKEKALVEANAKAERKAAQVREIEQAVAPLVVENWSQGEVALRGYITDPELTATAQHIAERSGIFLEAVSPRRVIVDAIAFSADEKHFATFADNSATVYLTPTETNAPTGDSLSVAQFPVDKYDGARYLCGNPAFVDAASDKIEENSQFLLCRDDGVVAFLSFDANGATSTREIDFRVSEPQKGRVAWGRPTLATDDSGQTRLFVADAAGQGSIYSFPEGRLLKRFAICEPVDDFIPLLIATPDGRALFTADLDGSFKRWSGDGEKLETLTLPLSDEPDFSFGGFARKIDVSPDGKTFYATDESGKFVVWDVAAKKAIYVGQEPGNPAQGERCGISPTANFILRVYHIDADRFLTIGFNDRWRVWDLANRDPNGVPANFELRAADAEPSYGLRSCNISPSRRRFAIYLNSHQFELYDIEERRALVRSEGLLHSGMYTLASAAYLPQSDRILVGTHGFHSLASYSPQTLRAETQYVPYPDAKMNFMVGLNMFASSLAVPDVGDEFAASFCSGDVFFFKDGAAEPTGKLENPFETDANAEWFGKLANLPLLAASPNGSRLVGKMANGDEFILWDWKTRAELKRWPAQKSESSAKNFQAAATSGLEFINETELLEIKGDGSVVRYNVKTGERVVTIPTPRFDLNNVSAPNLVHLVAHSLSNDRRQLALGFADGLVAVVDLTARRPVFFDATLWKPLPKRPQTNDSPNTLGCVLTRSVNGFAWSRDDSLLCATFLNGQAILLETRHFTRLETFVVGDPQVARSDDPNAVTAGIAFFTRDDKLVTADTSGFLKRWDFRPSPEKATLLDAERGACCLSGTSRPNVWARVCEPSLIDIALRAPYSFSLFNGDQEIYRRPRVETFQRLTEPNAEKETFLMLDKIGFLTAVDETGAPVKTDVDWNLNAPGATADTLKIARLLEEFHQKETKNSAERNQEFARLINEIRPLAPQPSDATLAWLALLDAKPNDVAELDPTSSEMQAELENLRAALENTKTISALQSIVDVNIRSVENFEQLYGLAELGFIRVAVAPNRRAFAAIGKQDGALYVMTLAEADKGWRLVAKPSEEDDPFTYLAFRRDSRELAAVDESGAVAFVPFDAAPGNSGDVVWSNKSYFAAASGASTLLIEGALAYSPSGKFLLQTGVASDVYIWNAETRELAQIIELDLYDRILRDANVISGLAPLRLNDDGDDAFVVAACDGVLRFYRYDAAAKKFVCVYIVSHNTLSDLMESGPSPEEFAQPQEGESQNSLQTAATASVYAQDENVVEDAPEGANEDEIVFEDAPEGANANEDEIVFEDAPEGANANEDEIVFEEETSEAQNAPLVDESSRDIFWYAKKVNCLSVSDDPKTLYVGTDDVVRAYDLDEIRRNIKALPDYWRAFDVESATGLRYELGDGLRFIERDRLVPIEAQP